MALSDLTDPNAVLAAIAEFDAIGQTAFLQKYGFGPARTYFLVQDGRRYDSKAIVGAAHGKQHPRKGPLRGADFSGGEMTVMAKLQSLGFKVEKRDGSAPNRSADAPMRNPDWTREETILALDLYARRRPQLPGEGDADIIRLSSLLRAYAAQRGVTGKATFRNPNGVSMKVGNLSRLDRSDNRAGLKHGSSLEERVWAEFMPDLTRLSHAARQIIEQIEGPTALLNQTETPPVPEAVVAVSRGPAPSYGEVRQFREDGENSVYLMQLTGPVELLFPKRHLHGMAVVKVGRSNDVTRRTAEMNCGFPPGLGLVWRTVQAQAYPSGADAHAVEQALLLDLSRRGFAIGKEFAIVPLKEIDVLLAKAIQRREDA